MASVDREDSSGTKATHPATEKMALEIESLKTKYSEDCRVIQNIGDFAYVVQVTLKEFDIKMKFQVSVGYPCEPVEVIITSQNNSEGDITELQQYLTNSNKTGLISEYTDLAVQWLTENHIISSPKPIRQKVKKNKHQKKTSIPDTEKKSTKKASMKTAEDVIKRILWDNSLDPETFTVGYIDRFTGLTEKNFSKFSWEDLASVDYTVLAIPKHRIQYFKYKDVIVWDKRERLDNFFGSAGSEVRISDVIEEYAKKESSLEGNSITNGHVTCDGGESSNNVNTAHCDEDDSDDDDEDDDDDSDDDVCVILETPKGASAELSDEEFESWQNKLRPNYFLCQRITSSEVLENVSTMQNQILDLDSRYVSCCIQPYMLHVTLCTLGLQPQHIADVAEILRSNKDDLAEMAKACQNIHLSGVSHFFQRVVYGKVNCDQNFMNYCDHIRALVREAGINISDNYEFVPHMTILKVSRPVARQIGTKKVPSWMYEDFSDLELGHQAIDGIYLCSMTGEKVPGQFYESPFSISLV